MPNPEKPKFEPEPEEDKEKSGEEAREPLFDEESRELYSELLETKMFKEFVNNVKSFESEAKQKGVDLTEALKFLETGEGDPSVVRKLFSELSRKEVDVEKVKRENLVSSEEELERVLALTKWGKILSEFEFFIKTIESKKHYKEEHKAEKILSPPEKNAPKWESVAWIERRQLAKKTFFEDMKDDLKKRDKSFEIIGNPSSSPHDFKEARETIDEVEEKIKKKRKELADEYNISEGEIYSLGDSSKTGLD